MNDPKNHDRLVKKIAEACHVAKQINCPMMTVVGGNDQPGMTQAEMHENIIDGPETGGADRRGQRRSC